jgi:putative phosphoesterase
MKSQSSEDRKDFLIGIISDTHSRLNQATLNIFKGVDIIIHAGDIGAPEILEVLEHTAPVIAVRGNMDGGSWINDLPDTRVVKVGKVLLYVLHDLYELDLDPQAGGFSAVISGHTHRPAIEEQNGVLYLNPGSISYPGYADRATIVLLQVKGKRLSARFVEVGE